MILDTSFLIDLMQRDVGAINKLNEMIKTGEPQIVTSLTIFELFSSLTRSYRPIDEKNKVMTTLKGILTAGLDNESAEKAGEIDGNLIKEDKTISPIYCMIAGIALSKKDKILTRNIKDFSKIKGLQIESY